MFTSKKLFSPRRATQLCGQFSRFSGKFSEKFSEKLSGKFSGKILPLVLSATMLAGCGVFANDDDYSNDTVEQLYAKAQQKMSDKSWLGAVDILRTLEAKYPYGDYAEQAQLDTIYCYYRGETPGFAVAAADRFIKLHPTHESADYAYYLKGLASFNEDKSVLGRIMGNDDLSDRDATATRNALSAFEDVYTLFPDSQYAAESKKQVKYLIGTLARHEIVVADYYYSRGAYVAAVNRAKSVVEQYSATPAVERALAIMMSSYENMGFEELAADTRRVLALNYPQSNYLSAN